MISPEAVYGVREKVCDICIVTFSDVVVEEIRKNFDCTTVAEIGSVNGGRPIYLLEYKGKKIAFYMTMISSAAAGACLEEARCLTGAGSYIMFGSCGALNREITAGKIIVPTQAYRDEGLSYHYAPPADYITMKNAGRVSEWLEEMGLPYVSGRTWTSDAIYRETKANVDKRKAEGCIAVEMVFGKCIIPGWTVICQIIIRIFIIRQEIILRPVIRLEKYCRCKNGPEPNQRICK